MGTGARWFGRSGRCTASRQRLMLEPLEGRLLLSGGPITIQGEQFVSGGAPVFLNIIGYQPLEPGQSVADEVRLSRIQEDIELFRGFQGGSDPVVLRVYPQPTPAFPVPMPKEFYDGMRDLGFWIIRDIYFDSDYWAADAITRGQAKVDAVLSEVGSVDGQDRILAWEIGNEFLAPGQPRTDELKAFLNAIVAYIKTRVNELWPGQGVSDYVTWASWPPCDPLRTDGQPVVVDTLDFVSYNVYSYEPVRMRDHQAGPGTGTPYAGYLAALRAYHTQQGLNVPLVVSETGYPDCPWPVPEHSDLHPWAPQYRKGGMESRAVAEGLADRYWDARLSGAVAGFGLFEWNDEWHKAGTPWVRDHPEEFFGIVEFDPVTYEARPKWQFETIRTLYAMADTPGLIESLVPAATSLGPEGTTTVTVHLSDQAVRPLRLRWEASRGYFVDTIEVTDEWTTVEFYAGGRALGPATLTAIVIDADGRADSASCTVTIQPSGNPTIEALTLSTENASGRVADVDLDQSRVACWIKTDGYWPQPFWDMTSVWVRPDGYWWTAVHNQHDGHLYACIVPKDYDPLLGPPPDAPTAILTALNDSDNDLCPDDWERLYFDAGDPDPLRYGRYDDPDNDEADNLDEYLRGSNPALADNDSDADGLLDNWETTYFGSLEHDSADDPERDGLPNLDEQARGLHPFRTQNVPPTDIALSNSNVAENQPVGALVGTFSTTDTEPPETPFTYALAAGIGSDDNASFAIVGDELRTAATFDYEAKNSYSIRVRTTDTGGLWYEEALAIGVTNVNEPPVNTVPGPQSVGQDTDLVLSTATGNAVCIADVDAGANPVRVILTATNGVLTLTATAGLSFTDGDGTADATMQFTGAIADINAALDGLVFRGSPLYHGPASAQIATNDQGHTGMGDAQEDTDAIAITVSPSPPPVVFVPPLPDDPTVILLCQAFEFDINTDLEGQHPLTYSLVRHPPWLRINEDTGILSGTPHGRGHLGTTAVTVRADDGHGGLSDHTFDVTVLGQVIELGSALPVPLTKVTITDARGDQVTVRGKAKAGIIYLTRGVAPDVNGVYHNEDPADFCTIETDGTDAKASIKVKSEAAVKGLVPTASVCHVLVTGSLKGLSAPLLNVEGNVTFTGGVGKLALGNVAGQHTIAIGSDPLMKPASLVFGRVQDTTLHSDTPLKSLTVAEWLDTDATPDETICPWIRKLTCAGDFEAGMALSGAGATKGTLGKASIVGTLRDAVWSVTGGVRSVAVGRWGAGAILAVGVTPGPDGEYFTPDDGLGNGSLRGLTIAAYDTVAAKSFGVTSAQLGKISLGGLSLPLAALPYQQGDFLIVWAANALHKGVALPLWNEKVDVTQLRSSLANLRAIGVNWVELNVFWFQDDINSTVIAPDFTRWSASDTSVRTAIDEAHRQGMKVMLKPMVDLRNDPENWRGNIPGTAAWFTGPQGYGAFLNHWAAIAQEKGVEMLCVGTELVATNTHEDPAEAEAAEACWRALIADVRARYSGPLAYAANHGGTQRATEENIAWWDALDYIGLDAYYPLTTKADPTPAELEATWAARAAMIEAWLAGLDPADRKPVLFTEVGYRSWDGANMDPADLSSKGSTDVDLQEQADCYRALLATLWRQESWFEGVFWWNWEVDPNPTWEAPNWYTPQGKPAQAVLQQFYG